MRSGWKGGAVPQPGTFGAHAAAHQLGQAFADRQAQIGQGQSGLRYQHRQQHAVAILEPPLRTVDIGIQTTQWTVRPYQRHDQATALCGWRGALGAVAQATRARCARLVQPGCDGLQQHVGVFLAGQRRAGNLGGPVARAQHQQRPFGSGNRQ